MLHLHVEYYTILIARTIMGHCTLQLSFLLRTRLDTCTCCFPSDRAGSDSLTIPSKCTCSVAKIYVCCAVNVEQLPLFKRYGSCLYLKYYHSVYRFLCHHRFDMLWYCFCLASKTVPQIQRLGAAAAVVPTDQAPIQFTRFTLSAKPSDLRRQTAQSEMTKVGDFLPSCILTAVSHTAPCLRVYIYIFALFLVVSDSPPVRDANHCQRLRPLEKMKSCWDNW